MTPFLNVTLETPENSTSYPTEPDELLSAEQRDLAIAIVQIIYFSAIVVSLPLTTFNIIVFLHPAMRGSTSAYVVGISAAQLLFMLANVVQQIMAATMQHTMTNAVYLTYFLYIAIYGATVARNGTHVVTCLLSVERLYAIVRPLHSKSFFLTKHSVVSMLAGYLLAAVWHLYIPTSMVIFLAGTAPSGRKIYAARYTDFYLKYPHAYNAMSVSAKLVLSSLAIVLQLFLNLLTVLALRRHNAAIKRVQSSSNENDRHKQEKQMTVSILAVTLCYALFALPAAVDNLVMKILELDYAKNVKYTRFMDVLLELFLGLMFLSCGTDFVWFVTLSSSYRKTFLGLFERLIKWKRSESSDGAIGDSERADVVHKIV